MNSSLNNDIKNKYSKDNNSKTNKTTDENKMR